MRPTAALLKTLWRHSPVGFAGVVVIASFFWLPAFFALPAIHIDAHVRRDLVLAMALLAGLPVLFAGALMGAAWSRMGLRLQAARLLPGHARHTGQALWLAWALTCLLTASPAWALAGWHELWWALPWSIGWASAALLAGLAVTVTRWGGRSFIFAVAAIAFANPLWWRPVSEWLREELPAGDARSIAAAACGLVLAGLWAVSARTIASRLAGGQVSDWDWAKWTHDAQLRLLAKGAGRLHARDPSALVMPVRGVGLGAEWGGLGFMLLFLFVFGRWVAPTMALPVLAMLVSYVAWAAAPFANGVWVSPRLLLLPRGARRRGLAWALYRQALAAALLRALPPALLASAVLVLARPMPWETGAAFAAFALGTLAPGAAMALAAVVWTRSPIAQRAWPAVGHALFLVALAAVGHFVFGLDPALEAVAALWPWVALACTLGAALAGALLLLVNGPWSRLDWQRMPTSPMLPMT